MNHIREPVPAVSSQVEQPFPLYVVQTEQQPLSADAQSQSEQQPLAADAQSQSEQQPLAADLKKVKKKIRLWARYVKLASNNEVTFLAIKLCISAISWCFAHTTPLFVVVIMLHTLDFFLRLHKH